MAIGNGPPDDPTRTSGGVGPLPETASKVPESIGDYRILSKLGEGGMGVVLEAEQRHPKRRVALKVVRGGDFVDDRRVRMFQREIDTLARLRHPNIGAIYESGCTEDGRHFFAMEIVRGPTLDEFLSTRPRQADRSELEMRLRVFRKIADAVHYAHQRGVIHRDLKPSNIIVVEPEEEARDPEVKILDFGLARITDGDVAAASMATEIGTIKGTLPYMSPEQARGDPSEIDVRSDVYALGIILYEMLTGDRPYDVQNTTLIDAVRVICQEPPRPLRRSWSGSRRVDSDLETIVGKALEKDPDRRYPSAASLSEDVGRYLRSQPILARPPSTAYQLRKFANRNRALVGGVVATFAVLVAGTVTSTVLGLREARQRHAAENARADVEAVARFQASMLENLDPAETGRAMVGSLRDGIATGLRRRGASDDRVALELDAFDGAVLAVNPTDVARRVLDESLLRPASNAIARDFHDRPLIESRLRRTLARTYIALGLIDQAEPDARLAVETATREFGPEDPRTLRARGTLASVLWHQGRLDEAERIYMDTFATARRVVGDEDDVTLDAAYDLAIVYWKKARYGEAEDLLATTLDTRRSVFGDDDPDTLDASNGLASLYWGQNRWEEAAGLFAWTLDARRRVLGELHPDSLGTANNLALVFMNLGRYDEAETILSETLRTVRAQLGDDHPRTLRILANLALSRSRQGRLDEAASLDREVLEARRRTMGLHHPDVRDAMNNLAVVLIESGSLAEARELLDELIALDAEHPSDNESEHGTHLHTYAELFMKSGELDRAAEWLRRALAIYERTGSRHLGLAHYQLATIAAGRGRRREAVDSLRRAIESGIATTRIAGDPTFDPLRGDPEFEGLLAD